MTHDSAPGQAGPREDLGQAPDSVRTRFRLLERFAPAVGARWAEQLWFTPPEPPGIQRRPPGMTEGERFEATWSGHTVVGECWGQGPAVYLVHGWGGWRGHLGAFVQPLLAAGHRVIAFDMPCHNESGPGDLGPRRTSGFEFARALAAVVNRHGPAHGVIAHSLGTMAAAVALRDGLTAGRLVFLAPVANAETLLDPFERYHGFGRRIRTRVIARIERRQGAPMQRVVVPVLADQIATVPPLLVIHDPDDRQAPQSEGADIVAAWPGSSLLSTSGLGRLAHYRILRDRRAIAAAVAFVSPVPAGEPTTTGSDTAG